MMKLPPCPLGRKCLSLSLSLLNHIYYHRTQTRIYYQTRIHTQSYLYSFLSNLSLPDSKLLALIIETGREQGQERCDVSGLIAALKLESCNLKRLDIRELNYPIGAQGMELLLKSVASPSCRIQDLGISLSTTAMSEEENKARCSILTKAFTSNSSLSKIKVLRFNNVDSDEAAQSVVEILGSPPSNCSVRFLHIFYHLQQNSTYHFFNEMQQVQGRIEYLQAYLYFRTGKISENHPLFSDLADFLWWENCSLLWLHCRIICDTEYQYIRKDISIAESLQLRLANALEGNYRLTTLRFPWTSVAAQSRAEAFLARNRLYKSAGLDSKDERAKPKVARLFLCGNGEVGKTTIRKALVKLNQHRQSTRTVQVLSNINRVMRPHQEELRTRGLEIHQLCFKEGQKFVMFDLAGQPDYHTFHHFFMNKTSNDLFMVVCKYTQSTLPSHVESQLEYWLKFIVSHRNTVHGPNPKIMLVLNFFTPIVDVSMQATAQQFTEGLQSKYAEVLDFVDDHVFGINAVIKDQTKPLLLKLEVALTDLLEHRPMIPNVCHDLLDHILPKLTHPPSPSQRKLRCRFPLHCATTSRNTSKEVNIVAYEDVVQYYLQQQPSKQYGEDPTSLLVNRIQVALVELHNIGEVIFFPSIHGSMHANISKKADGTTSSGFLPLDHQQAKCETSSSNYSEREVKMPIITNPNWFCNRMVGDLLAPEGFGGKCERNERDVRYIIQRTGCPSYFLDGIMSYMGSLQLCFVIKAPGDYGEKKIFFPAVASNRGLDWPPIFNKRSDSTHFYGRRLQCRDTEKQLIPSGIFARLQVKLLEFCGVDSVHSYRMGYRWSSFVNDSIGVVVRFGGAKVSSVNHGHALAAGTSQSASLHTKETDDHPEWIDILLCCPAGCSPSTQDFISRQTNDGTSAEDTIMNGIKRLIFELCQATTRGIPTVVLEEKVLKEKSHEDVIPLAHIQETIRKKGLTSDVAWPSQESSHVVDLLLPNELKPPILNQYHALKQIQAEFYPDSSLDHAGLQQVIPTEDNSEVQVEGQFKVLYASIQKLDKKMDNIAVLVQDIKRDIKKVMDSLHQMQIEIISNCSTRLLSQLVKKGNVPAYPYLTDSKGMLRNLEKLLAKKAEIHFLCESPLCGPHKVEGAPGKVVVVEEGILMKAAPILVPALRVMCCAARFAVNVYLPGVAPAFFDPLQKCLEPLGLTSEDLQSQIMPKALNALFDGVDIQIQKLQNAEAQYLDVEGAKDAVAALQEILGQREDINMEKDFGLYWVRSNDNPQAMPLWVCKEHAEGHEKLQHSSNPFS